MTMEPAPRDSGRQWPAVLGWSALALAIGLQIVALRVHSVTGDEAHHLLAGHQALRYGQNLLNWEHPPLVKLLVAAPLLLEDAPLAPPLEVDQALAWSDRIFRHPDLVLRAAERGRWVVLVLIVVPFLFACRALGHRFAGPRGGWVLVAMVGLSSTNVLPHLSTLQTDAAVSLAGLLILLAALRFADAPTLLRAVVLGAALGFGLAAKFSGLLFVPSVALGLALGLAAERREEGDESPTRRKVWSASRKLSGWLLVTFGTAMVVVHVVYLVASWGYAPEPARATLASYCDGRGTLTVGERLESWREPLLAVEQVDPPLAQWLIGLLGVRAQNAEGAYVSYAFGEVSRWGRWWYFPVVLLLKTPIAVVLLSFLALASVARKGARGFENSREDLRHEHQTGGVALVVVTAGIYLAMAMTSNYNLGARHLLPVIPLLYLPLATWLARRGRLAILLVVVLALEALVLSPRWMSATSTWWLGASNPVRAALAAGNLESRQNLRLLAQEHRHAHGETAIGVLYPTLNEEVLHAYLPEAHLVRPEDWHTEELPPGLYAVNVTVEQLVPAILAAPDHDLPDQGLRTVAEQWLPLWQEVRSGRDLGLIAETFRLYEIPSSAVSSGV